MRCVTSPDRKEEVQAQLLLMWLSIGKSDDDRDLLPEFFDHDSIIALPSACFGERATRNQGFGRRISMNPDGIEEMKQRSSSKRFISNLMEFPWQLTKKHSPLKELGQEQTRALE